MAATFTMKNMIMVTFGTSFLRIRQSSMILDRTRKRKTNLVGLASGWCNDDQSRTRFSFFSLFSGASSSKCSGAEPKACITCQIISDLSSDTYPGPS